MPGKPLPPYHIGEQPAVALLPPVVDTLGELEQRLTQYVDRLRLTEADRRSVESARAVITDAQSKVAEILATAGSR